MEKDDLKSVLNELLKVHNDRIKGYETALNDVKDVDEELKTFFYDMLQKSGRYKEELLQFAAQANVEVSADSSSVLSSVYRAWMDLKTKFSGYDKRTALEIYADGEDAAINAYENILTAHQSLDTSLRELLTRQKDSLYEDRENLRKEVAAN